MGLWGSMLLTRAPVDVAEGEAVPWLAGKVAEVVTGDGGWRLVTILGGDTPGRDQVLAAAVALDQPVLCAYVVDSDCAQVHCATPGGQVIRFVLHPHSASEYGLTTDEAEQAAAVSFLLAWAGEAADEQQVRLAVAGELTFAEDSVRRLAVAMGMAPLAELPDYLFGDLTEHDGTEHHGTEHDGTEHDSTEHDGTDSDDDGQQR